MNDKTILDQLLDYSCEELHLSPTNHKNAEDRYKAVGQWLDAADSPLHEFHPVIYPQGSFRIGTTTHPIGNNEHDLDFVCELRIDPAKAQAVAVLNAVESRLRAHGVYGPMVERLKRCVRLNYKGEFHMDILPAVPKPGRQGTEVLVPDRTLGTWKTSNPKGYAAWFEKRGTERLDELKKARIEPIPSHEAADEKLPLQRAVQLIKRARDRYFEHPEDGTRSIVLTTLAARLYKGQSSTAHALHDILGEMKTLAGQNPGGLVVLNPADASEILSEQWSTTSSTYAAFRFWLQWFGAEWDEVLQAGDLASTEAKLEVLFGEEIAKSALRKHAAEIERLREARALRVSKTGTLGSAGVGTVRPNTFYGG